MVNLARKLSAGACIRIGTMETFLVDETFDAALITGRTLSYLTTNHQLLTSFKAIQQNLKADGLLVFDAIDAKTLFATMIEDPSATIQANASVGTIRRESRNTPLLTSGTGNGTRIMKYVKTGRTLFLLGTTRPSSERLK